MHICQGSKWNNHSINRKSCANKVMTINKKQKVQLSCSMFTKKDVSKNFSCLSTIHCDIYLNLYLIHIPLNVTCSIFYDLRNNQFYEKANLFGPPSTYYSSNPNLRPTWAPHYIHLYTNQLFFAYIYYNYSSENFQILRNISHQNFSDL